MESRLRIKCLGLIGMLGAVSGMACTTSASPPAVQCAASGAKLFQPPMSAQAICARFDAALSKARAGATPVTVELRFKPPGVATAVVKQAGGTREFNLAVSDRAFRAADLDKLATDVAAGLRAR